MGEVEVFRVGVHRTKPAGEFQIIFSTWKCRAESDELPVSASRLFLTGFEWPQRMRSGGAADFGGAASERAANASRRPFAAVERRSNTTKRLKAFGGPGPGRTAAY